MDQQRYWITVVSKDHLQRGVAGGFMQANHGKQGPLKRIKEGDWVIFYSPKLTMNGDEKLQAFTTIGQASDDNIYQHKMSEDFIPYRRNIKFHDCREIPIAHLINDLEFIPNKQSWGYPFRFGFFEIGEHDFKLLKEKLLQ
ncbi:MAG TPA: EVE domain-containing protein [Mucilaginibacter sp.]|nr:EVE domain-containing protein [Mucilaginibacter sp.]